MNDRNVRASLFSLSMYLAASYLPSAFWLPVLVDSHGVSISPFLLFISPVVLYVSLLTENTVEAIGVLILYLVLLLGLAWRFRRSRRLGIVIAGVLFALSLAQALWLLSHSD